MLGIRYVTATNYTTSFQIVSESTVWSAAVSHICAAMQCAGECRGGCRNHFHNGRISCRSPSPADLCRKLSLVGRKWGFQSPLGEVLTTQTLVSLFWASIGKQSAKIADLQAHQVSHCDTLWACTLAIFSRHLVLAEEKTCRGEGGVKYGCGGSPDNKVCRVQQHSLVQTQKTVIS